MQSRTPLWVLPLLAFAIGCGEDPVAATTGTTAGGGGSGGGGAPECCGCLCADATWSCTAETCLDEAGQAKELRPEFGLFDLPGGSYTTFGTTRKSPRARVSYSFQPAESDPENKPLMVLFNGGPGGPALGVLALNIGHYTFDPSFTDGAPYADNPHRFTEFANLLYIDQPGTGYGYHLPRADGTSPPLRFDSGADAADYLRVLFRFLARHPQLAQAPIVIFGESYGGMRATHMTGLMLEYPSLLSGGDYLDPELHDEIVAFLGARRTDLAPTDWTPADVREVFTHQILIEPFLSQHQIDLFLDPRGVRQCIRGGDPFECDVTTETAEALVDAVIAVAVDPALISAVLRCDITTVAWLYAAERQGAYPREEAFPLGNDTFDLSKLTATFGEPEPGDAIYAFFNPDTRVGLDIFTNFSRTDLPLRSIHEVPTFITGGALDLYFGPLGLRLGLAQHTDILSSVTFDEAAPADADRPGQLRLEYVDGLPYGGGTITVRHPQYLAGHSVTHRAPGQLSVDVAEFLAATP